MGIFFARFAAKRNRNVEFEAAGKRNETETRDLQLPRMGDAKRNETKLSRPGPPFRFALKFSVLTVALSCYHHHHHATLIGPTSESPRGICERTNKHLFLMRLRPHQGALLFARSPPVAILKPKNRKTEKPKLNCRKGAER